MTFLLSLLGFIGKTAFGWLKMLPWQAYAIFAGIVALLFVWHLHTGWEKAAYNDAFNKGWAAQKVYTDINLRSINDLQTALDQKNSESEQRAAALASSKAQDAMDVKKANAAQADDAPRRGILQGIQDSATLKPSCRVSSALSGAVEGL